MKYKTFEDWKVAVNQAIERAIGLSGDDLPDFAYWHAYAERKLTPSACAREVIRAAKTFY